MGENRRFGESEESERLGRERVRRQERDSTRGTREGEGSMTWEKGVSYPGYWIKKDRW